jgi:hypothetical protein
MKPPRLSLLLWPWLLHAGCAAQDLTSLQKDMAALKASVDALQARNRKIDQQLRLGWANALCREEVRQILARVRKECGKDRCVNRKIATAVSEVDPTHQGYFATMMSSQRHEVFYLREQETSLDGSYKRRLRELVQPAWLPTTDFLVVSNVATQAGPARRRGDTPTREELSAERRGGLIIDEMLRMNFLDNEPPTIAKERIIHWVFGFTIKKGEAAKMSVDDWPPPPGRDLKNSVWVFRVDCAGAGPAEPAAGADGKGP